MKNIIFITLLFSTTLSGQLVVNFGGEVGLNMVSGKLKYYEEEDNFLRDKVSYVIGLSCNIHYSKFINFHTGFYNSILGSRGYESNRSGKSYLKERKYNGPIQSFIIPLNYLFTFNVGKNKMHFTFGPEMQIFISGKYRNEEKTTINGIVKSKIDKGKYKIGVDYKRLNWGLNFGIAYQFNSKFIKIFYTPGLNNISLSSYGEVIKQQQYGISFGYEF